MANGTTDTKRVVGGGLAGGIAAWLIGYLVVYLRNANEIENSLGSGVLEALTNENVTWKLVGWIFYNAHNVDLESSVSGGGQSESETYSLLSRASPQAGADLTGTIPEFLYLLVPVVVLVRHEEWQRTRDRVARGDLSWADLPERLRGHPDLVDLF